VGSSISMTVDSSSLSARFCAWLCEYRRVCSGRGRATPPRWSRCRSAASFDTTVTVRRGQSVRLHRGPAPVAECSCQATPSTGDTHTHTTKRRHSHTRRSARTSCASHRTACTGLRSTRLTPARQEAAPTHRLAQHVAGAQVALDAKTDAVLHHRDGACAQERAGGGWRRGESGVGAALRTTEGWRARVVPESCRPRPITSV
jgi:hypothetical protein